MSLWTSSAASPRSSLHPLLLFITAGAHKSVYFFFSVLEAYYLYALRGWVQGVYDAPDVFMFTAREREPQGVRSVGRSVRALADKAGHWAVFEGN